MKIVKESLNFERGKDPLDTLNIGNPSIRKINQSLNNLKNEIDNGFSSQELSFSKVVEDSENLKFIVEATVINFIDSKYNFNKIFEQIDGDTFVSYEIDKYNLLFKKSAGGSTVYIIVINPKGERTEIPGSLSLKFINAKIQNIIKKFNLPINKKEA